MGLSRALVASASIPFFFQPARLRWGQPYGNVSYLVDGGSCSNFPIEVFDRLDDQAPRWPTFGVKLSARAVPGSLLNKVDGPLGFALALPESVVNGNGNVHLADPCVCIRTIFVDTSAVSSTNFDLTSDQQNLLITQGQQAARDFLAGWNWAAYKSTCGNDPARIALARRGRRLSDESSTGRNGRPPRA